MNNVKCWFGIYLLNCIHTFKKPVHLLFCTIIPPAMILRSQLNRPMFFLVLSVFDLKNLTIVVIWKLYKLVHTRSCPYCILMLRTWTFTWVLVWKKKPLYPIPVASFVSIVLYLILISINILWFCLLTSCLHFEIRFVWFLR